MDADLRILFNVPLVLFVVVVLFALLLVVVLLVKVEGVFARGALNVIIIEEEEVVVVVGGEEEEDIPLLLLLLFSSRSEERVRAWSSEDIFFFCIVFLSLALCFSALSFLSLSLSLFFFFFFSLFRLLFFRSSSTSEIYTPKNSKRRTRNVIIHTRARVDEYKRASTTAIKRERRKGGKECSVSLGEYEKTTRL